MQQGPAHHVPRLPKRSRICCFFPRVEALRITILFAAGRRLGALRLPLKGAEITR